MMSDFVLWGSCRNENMKLDETMVRNSSRPRRGDIPPRGGGQGGDGGAGCRLSQNLGELATERHGFQGRRGRGGGAKTAQIRKLYLPFARFWAGGWRSGTAAARQDADGEGGEERRMNVGKWECCQ